MGENRGKKFEAIIKDAFMQVEGVSIDRIPDQTNFYKGSQNICDFIVYKEPNEYYIECKSVHGNTFPLTNLTDTQRIGLHDKSQIQGVYAGVICWWVDNDVTLYIPIATIYKMIADGKKSIRYDEGDYEVVELAGKKKRTFFDYDMNSFFFFVGGNHGEV